VYELALVLYAMLTGRLPWDDASDPGARLAAPPPSAIEPAVPLALSDAVMRALSTRVERRPASVEELAETVRRAARAESSARRTQPAPALVPPLDLLVARPGPAPDRSACPEGSASTCDRPPEVDSGTSPPDVDARRKRARRLPAAGLVVFGATVGLGVLATFARRAPGSVGTPPPDAAVQTVAPAPAVPSTPGSAAPDSTPLASSPAPPASSPPAMGPPAAPNPGLLRSPPRAAGAPTAQGRAPESDALPSTTTAAPSDASGALPWCRALMEVQCAPGLGSAGASSCEIARKNLASWEADPPPSWPAHDAVCQRVYPDVRKNFLELREREKMGEEWRRKNEEHERVVREALTPAPESAIATMPACVRYRERICSPEGRAALGKDACESVRSWLGREGKGDAARRADTDRGCARTIEGIELRIAQRAAGH